MRQVQMGTWIHANGSIRKVLAFTDSTVTFVAGPPPEGKGKWLAEGSEHTVDRRYFEKWAIRADLETQTP
uniref:Uncharacterized protein n=1 Tax=uncultured Caudovirales phage TaxID=2100421 RepID=A0A6J5L2V6_9CAUD|nr:hypothetical protein UFOVP114_96 [uncultured Caudovirales phage]